MSQVHSYTVKPVKWQLKKDQKLFFKTDYRFMQVKSIAECSNWSILQYFRPPLSYHFPLRPWFCLFLSDRLRQVYCSSVKAILSLPTDIPYSKTLIIGPDKHIFERKLVIIFLPISLNICFGCSKEPSH